MTNIKKYDEYLTEKRAEAKRRFHAVVKSLPGPKESALYLIYWSEIVSRMAEKVPSWMERAGKRCLEQGYSDLGKELVAHSKEEEGHHLWSQQDSCLLRQWFEKEFKQCIDEKLLKHSADGAQALSRYRDLHDAAHRKKPGPFCQMAIEHEIERLSTDLGPLFLSHFTGVLGTKLINNLSFVSKHIHLDKSHNEGNRETLSEFLRVWPSSLAPLAETGRKSLDVYLGFSEEVVALVKSRRIY